MPEQPICSRAHSWVSSFRRSSNHRQQENHMFFTTVLHFLSHDIRKWTFTTELSYKMCTPDHTMAKDRILTLSKVWEVLVHEMTSMEWEGKALLVSHGGVFTPKTLLLSHGSHIYMKITRFIVSFAVCAYEPRTTMPVAKFLSPPLW